MAVRKPSIINKYITEDAIHGLFQFLQLRVRTEPLIQTHFCSRLTPATPAIPATSARTVRGQNRIPYNIIRLVRPLPKTRSMRKHTMREQTCIQLKNELPDRAQIQDYADKVSALQRCGQRYCELERSLARAQRQLEQAQKRMHELDGLLCSCRLSGQEIDNRLLQQDAVLYGTYSQRRKDVYQLETQLSICRQELDKLEQSVHACHTGHQHH